MSTTDPGRGGRAERPGGGVPRPATPMVAVVVAAVAGLLGLLILKDVKDDGSGGGGGGGTSKTTTTTTTVTSSTSTPATTSSLLQRTGAIVVVANASGQDGAAGQLTTALKNRGYSTGTAVTANDKLDTTVVMVKSGDLAALAVARTLIYEMSLTEPVQSLPATAPTKDPIGSATVLVLLGKDKAGQPLRPLGETTTTAAPATETSLATDSTDTLPGG